MEKEIRIKIERPEFRYSYTGQFYGECKFSIEELSLSWPVYVPVDVILTPHHYRNGNGDHYTWAENARARGATAVKIGVVYQTIKISELAENISACFIGDHLIVKYDEVNYPIDIVDGKKVVTVIEIDVEDTMSIYGCLSIRKDGEWTLVEKKGCFIAAKQKCKWVDNPRYKSLHPS